MEIDWLIRLPVILFLLLASAIFSSSEVALFSLKKQSIKDISRTHSVIGGYIHNLLEFPRRLLITILISNTVVNVALSILGVEFAVAYSKTFSVPLNLVLLIQIIIITALILIFGEILPKLFANKFPVKTAVIVSIPLYWISIFIYPISKILTDILNHFSSKINYDRAKTGFHSSEIQDLAEVGKEMGTLKEDEHGLIEGLASFRSITVREIMTPRVDITAIEIDTPFNEIMQIITNSGHSRIPLYENDLDEIIGIIYAKDLLPYLSNEEQRKNLSLKKIARSAMFIPETKMINTLLREFQEKNMHVGIVVDEYGGTSGLVSLEDILEEIVGEIRDEFDKEENEIVKVDDNSYLLLGKISIDEINELLDYDFSNDSDDFDTVGGFIFNHAGTIPKEGYTFQVDKFIFTVKEVINKRINKVQVEMKQLNKE